jgi:hypothetical protein
LKSFTPKLSVLPEPQRALWPELKETPRHFVLYGGTAAALYYAHRKSIDFDFFSSEPFNPEALNRSLSFLRGGKPVQVGMNTLEVEVARGGGIVKVAFFGGLSYRRVHDPLMTEDGVLRAASPLDLLATKLRTIWSRSESKDYLDIDELVRQGTPLKDGLRAAYTVYNGEFNSRLSLQGLGYFEDGDLASLPESVKERLREQVNLVIGEALPEFAPLPGGIAPAEES